MKKRIVAGLILLVVSLVLITTSKAIFTVNMSIDGNSDVKVGDTITYKITLNETIVACNFNIEYNNSLLEFVGSETTNLSAAVNGNVVSCMYVDMTDTGTTEFKVKFKVLKESTENTSLGITNVKFRAKGKDTSYVENDIQGVNEKLSISTGVKQDTDNTGNTGDTGNAGDNQDTEDTTKPSETDATANGDTATDKSNKSDTSTKDSTTSTGTSTKDTTTSTTTLPKTGTKETTGYFLMICSILILFSGIMKGKENNLKKIFKSGGVN